MGIFVTGVNYSFFPGSTRPINGLLTIFESSLRQLAHPHGDAHVLTLKVGRHLMKRILVDPGNATYLLHFPVLVRLGYKPDNLHNLGRVQVEFNGTYAHSLREIVVSISTGSVIALVSLMVINEPSNFNAILGRTWIHAMKALPSSYHRRLSFLTPHG